MLNEEIKAAPKPTLESALEKDNLPWLNAQASAKPDDLCWVQPPDAENRMSGGGEGLRGEIPVSPSDPSSITHAFIRAKTTTPRLLYRLRPLSIRPANCVVRRFATLASFA